MDDKVFVSFLGFILFDSTYGIKMKKKNVVKKSFDIVEKVNLVTLIINPCALHRRKKILVVLEILS